MSDPRKKKPFLAVPQRQTLASISNNVQQKPVAAQPLSKEEINRRLDHEDAKWAAENEPSMPEKQVVGSNSREFGCDLASVSQQLTRDESVDVQMVEDNQYDDLFEEKPAAIDTPIINDMADDDGLGAAIDEALKYPTAGLKPAAAVVVPAAKPTTPADPLELVGAPKLTKDWRRNVEETGQWLAEFTRRKQLERRGIFTAAVSISAVPVAQLFAAEPEATESYSDEENYTSDEESDESEEE